MKDDISEVVSGLDKNTKFILPKDHRGGTTEKASGGPEFAGKDRPEDKLNPVPIE